MRLVRRLGVILLGLVGVARPLMGADVVINEIMYHPASENVLEEYVELHNRGVTNVNLTGWQFSGGVRFTFTNAVIPAGGYLVVAADLATFTNRYPGVVNVVGNWTGILSNNRDDLDLDDPLGDRVDSVRYADDGDWALRVRGPLSSGHRGWEWLAEHDGLGKSAELINPRLSNNSGQNWASSLVTKGTPGSANSVFATNVPPLILEVKHFPVVPTSTDTVVVTGRLLDEHPNGLTLTLHWRVDAANPPPFEPLAMSDDGQHEDGAPADGVFAATLPAQTNNAVIEFYLEASDLEGSRRTWPAAARQEDGSFAQTANVLYQVDDSLYSGSQPLYKLILRGTEQAELYTIGHSSDGSQNSDAQMNGTFISLDGTGTQLRYVVGFRNRGHGSRNRQPNNYRVSFRADDPWKDVTALNLNGQFTHLQHFGSVISLKSGLAGAEARPVQVRVNNRNYGFSNGPETYGSTYVANEVLNSRFADHRFPTDSSGNVYRAIRDIAPSSFNYRGEDPQAYTNTWFKQTNESEDDWTDLIRMLRVVGTNDLYTVENVRQVIEVEQWMLYLAVMGLFDNRETSLYNGENDDYFLYCGVADPRFRLLYFDLDTILGRGGSASNSLFDCTRLPAFNRLLNDPEFRPIYFRTLQRLIDTTFSADPFNTLLDQTLGDYVPANVLSQIKSWMDGRRAYARSQIPPDLPPLVRPPVATLSGAPRSPTPLRDVTLTVAGEGVTHYRFALNGAGLSPEHPVATPIQLTSLPAGTNALEVVGRNTDGLWQAETNATRYAWVVNPAWPSVRLNEVLAANTAALSHGGKFPDLIELYNEGSTRLDLSGLRLTDNLENPDQFTFPASTFLDANAYLILYANNPDGSSGFHVRFSLNQDGDGVYLFDRAAAGNTVLDSVVFGRQWTDLSIGRLGGSGEWVLAAPTFGSTNAPQATGDPRGLKINEWFTDGRLLFNNDFVELYNPSSLPVGLGGLFLTDNLSAAPNRHPIAPLSFIAASGYLAFEADGDSGQGPDHLNFKLAPEQGEIGLFAADLSLIDCVIYGPQQTDVSQGRSPNGATTLAFFLQPTPGVPNPYRASNVSTQISLLISLTNVWSFNQTANLTGVNWFDFDYDDRTWPTGPALLWHDLDVWPGPRNTPLALGRMTYYFRTHFTFTGDPATTTLMLSPWVDDGAVFYLNGELAYPLRMNTNAPITYDTQAADTVNNATLEGPYPLPGFRPRVGDNVLAVEVHQSGLSSQDVVLGAELTAVVTITNHLTLPIVLNEVFAHGETRTNLDGTTSDWVELFNPALTNLDLAGLSLTDDLDQPRKWVFPAGSIIPGGGHLVLRCDDARPASAANTGFALNAEGDELHLFDRTNGLLDSVKFGLQAADYSIGRVADGFGAWTLTLPTEGTENLPAALGDPAALKINEWMADPASGDDWLELYNPSLQPVDLSGLCLSDDPGNRALSPIPALSFIGASGDAYRRFIADGDQLKGADHTRFRLEPAGESLALYTVQGRVIDSLSFGFQPWNVAQGRFPDGTAAFASFPDSPSPAESNYLPLTNVVINELLSHTDPPLEDAVELYNPTDNAVNLGGWFLSNTARDLRRYVVPDPTVVPAHGYAVLYERGFGNTNSPTVFTFNSAHGDEVHLSQPGGSGSLTGYRAVARFGAAANGVSFGRYPTSIGADFVAMNRPTFGVDNPQTLDQFRQGTGAANSGPRVGPVVINEIMYHPPDLGGTNDNSLDEFVELANITSGPVRLCAPAAPTNTWRLGGGIDYVFPTNTTIPASGFLLLVNFDPFAQPAASNAFRAQYSLSADVLMFGPYRDKLANDRATVTLYQPDPPQLPPHPDAGFVPPVVVDRILYMDASPWPTNADGWGESLQRISPDAYGNEPLNWRAAAPTPGSANGSLPPDSDGDGMPDAWELNHFGTLARNGSGDFDNDGLTDLGEYLAGTEPDDPASALRLTLDPVPGEGALLQFTARAGRWYTLQSRDRLSDGAWLKVQDVPAGTSERAVQIPIAPTEDSRFYRLMLLSQP